MPSQYYSIQKIVWWSYFSYKKHFLGAHPHTPFISWASREELYLQLQVQVQVTQVVESSQGPKKFINMICFVGFFPM